MSSNITLFERGGGGKLDISSLSSKPSLGFNTNPNLSLFLVNNCKNNFFFIEIFIKLYSVSNDNFICHDT